MVLFALLLRRTALHPRRRPCALPSPRLAPLAPRSASHPRHAASEHAAGSRSCRSAGVVVKATVALLVLLTTLGSELSPERWQRQERLLATDRT